MDIQAPIDDYAANVTRLAAEGSAAVVAYIESLPADDHVAAVRATQRALRDSAVDAAGLDLYAAAMRELIDRGTFGVKAGRDAETDKLLDSYNAMSFNLAADLADCWPDDEL